MEDWTYMRMYPELVALKEEMILKGAPKVIARPLVYAR